METLKKFAIWTLCVIGLFIFTYVISNVLLFPEEIGGRIYNMTHKEEIVNKNVNV